MKSFKEFLKEKSKRVKFDPETMRWITILDKNHKQQKVLIKKKGGTILGGMGGKHTGNNLDDVY